MSNGPEWFLNTLIPALDHQRIILLGDARDLKALKKEIPSPSGNVAALLAALTKANQDELAIAEDLLEQGTTIVKYYYDVKALAVPDIGGGRPVPRARRRS